LKPSCSRDDQAVSHPKDRGDLTVLFGRADYSHKMDDSREPGKIIGGSLIPEAKLLGFRREVQKRKLCWNGAMKVDYTSAEYHEHPDCTVGRKIKRSQKEKGCSRCPVERKKKAKDKIVGDCLKRSEIIARDNLEGEVSKAWGRFLREAGTRLGRLQR